MSKNFSNSIFIAKLIKTIKTHRLFDAHDKVLIAVSGGIDSIALLHALIHFPKPLRPRIEVAHYNHKLRGAESDEDARFVKKICREWKVPHHEARAPRWKDKANLQERARSLRYLFLKRISLKRRIKKILTAHHADDQAETFLLHWIQGAGLKGLAGIPLARDFENAKLLLLRPLLLIGRRDIEQYAQVHQFPFREDSSNATTAYLRNRVRRLLTDFKEENRNLPETASLNSLFLQADQDCLEALVSEFSEKYLQKRSKQVTCLLSPYLRQVDSIRFRFLQRMVSSLKASALPSKLILEIDRLLQTPLGGQALTLPGGLKFQKGKKSFAFTRRSRQEFPPTSISSSL